MVTAVEGPGEYDVLEYEVWISAAPWMGHVAWRALPVEILASAKSGGLPYFWRVSRRAAAVHCASAGVCGYALHWPPANSHVEARPAPHGIIWR
ncbi:hypothetical protein Pars_0118 [Pyrobaculum arsenaticum DSM 13514]|uniref:Uncharacterized protein n=1 Tax=Pyrobaculum arsenaticum (strain DSM 13514 / JCM 11321 / PZ6) TaxID=340102 RepID=A4WH66_PYRAR|nr:hypothetical protein Pars_0118 [Pyrobaculum arsenaticum DSM 13514]